MNLSVKISTIITWFVVQTILSIAFYFGDKFVSGGETVIILLLSFPITYFIVWLRELKSMSKDEDNQ